MSEREREKSLDQMRAMTHNKRVKEDKLVEQLGDSQELSEREQAEHQKTLLKQLKKVTLKVPRSQNSLCSNGSEPHLFRKEKTAPNELLKMLASNITGVFKILNEQIYDLLFNAYMKAVTSQKSSNAKQISAFYQEINLMKQTNYAGLKVAMQVYVFVR